MPAQRLEVSDFAMDRNPAPPGLPSLVTTTKDDKAVLRNDTQLTAQNRVQRNGELEVLFIDQITFSSLLHVVALGRSVRTIWHFELIAPSAQRLLRVFRRLGLIRTEVRQIEYYIGQVVRNDTGKNAYDKVFHYARAICSKIKQEQLANNPLIKAMESEWATSKVVLYFEKRAEKKISLECKRIALVEWMLRTRLHIAPVNCILLIASNHWFSYIQEHAHTQGIRVIAYGYLWSLGGIVKACLWLIRLSRRLPSALLRALWGWMRRPVAGQSANVSGTHEAMREARTPTVAVRYWHRKLSFDPTERSEFFWLNGAGIPYSEVLLYDYIADEPLDAETLGQINARGIRLVGRGPGISSWYPTDQMVAVRRHIRRQLILGVLRCLVRGQRVSRYYVRGLWALARDYAYWYDFYAANRVRLSVGTLNHGVGQTLALDALCGVSAAYQYSASNILSPTTLLSAGENVQFVFSTVFEQLWREIEAPVDRFVHTGFIYDSAIQAVRGLNRVAETRKQLQDNGARFILCFFDENSANRWDILHWDDDAADDYEYLLKWLLSDPALGIVFKPKKSTNLFQRISRGSGLINQVKQTGRCKFLTSDTLVGSIYPAEAALMADVCIGKLFGGTATLEARLAGVPTVLIDTERFRSHPFYTWGCGRVIFTDWESLRAAVEQYRAAPEAYPEFGDWSPGLNELDPFQDGQASLRMGLYISWAYEALKEGASKQDALATASKKFAQRWGEGHIHAG